jgi:DUF438 domain-containing protein
MLFLRRLISCIIIKKGTTKTTGKKIAVCHVGPRQVHIVSIIMEPMVQPVLIL